MVVGCGDAVFVPPNSVAVGRETVAFRLQSKVYRCINEGA